ncbi:MAG: beta-ketoacyl-ACP synthase II, partial [Anaerolineae bacterium]
FHLLDKKRCGVLIGSGMGGMTVFYEGVETLLTKGFKRLTPFFVPYIITNMGGALLAIDLGFMGPNYSISTACATANYCIHAAARHIQNGDADLMLCGGTESPITPIGLAGFVAIKALSERNDAPQHASRPWDKERDGFVMGEGAGVLLLESLEHALKRGAPILAEYLGGGISCDAYHMTDPREDGIGVALCIEQALKEGGIAKEEVDYINAHATSTPVGDLCEIKAIKRCFGDHVYKLKINATKSMIGHCLGAAGGIEAIVAIKAILTGMLHPTKNLKSPEDALEGIDVVPEVAKAHDVKIALSNSFGFGGHNSSLLFSDYRL